MAIAFYIPDQAALLRKASEKEQQILRMRHTQWQFLVSLILEALRLYVESSSSAHYMQTYSVGKMAAQRKNSKQRKPSN